MLLLLASGASLHTIKSTSALSAGSKLLVDPRGSYSHSYEVMNDLIKGLKGRGATVLFFNESEMTQVHGTHKMHGVRVMST